MNRFCCDEKRRNAVAAHASLNGIEFLEVSDDPQAPADRRQRTLFIHFIKAIDASALAPENVRIEGGERVSNVVVTGVSVVADADARVLAVEVDRAGDFSVYTLRLVGGTSDDAPPAGFDIILSSVAFSFKVACPSDFDCETKNLCPVETLPQPEINYLAKDYASFRQLMFDRLAVLAPRWQERNAADLGVALVELLAYVGDYLSYQQDAVATEAYLGTARRRVSVRRHARLVDYHMHNGSNARAWVQVRVAADDVALGAGTLLLSRIPKLPALIAPPPSSLDLEKALNASPAVFETMHEARLYEAHNEILFYTWGDERCCLPRGATRATLSNDGNRLANLMVGDVLVFVEKRNPVNGRETEANPAHRHAVRLTHIEHTEDTLYTEDAAGKQPARVVQIAWGAADALPFPLCLWDVAIDADVNNKQPVGVALGNIVLADHGLTVTGETLGTVPNVNPVLDKISTGDGGGCSSCDPHAPRPAAPRFNPKLQKRPLTYAAPYRVSDEFDAQSLPPAAADAMRWATAGLLPSIRLEATFGQDVSGWMPQRDLLNSNPLGREFVVETETDATATLRFGDGRFGLRPASGTSFTATYRVGNGTAGNVGAGALAHIVSAEAAITGVSNPLPARGGLEPETINEVRQNAPAAFRVQERAVTPPDYGTMSERYAGVQRATATFRWTGSWRTVFLTVDRLGGRDVDAGFEREMRRHLERYRMAGHDLEIDSPRYITLEIDVLVCVAPDYSPGDVRDALLEIFHARTLADGRRGIFHPDNFTFGQTVYLSRIYAAAQSVDGVASVAVTKFQRQDLPGTGGIETGKIEFGRLEIARLSNDPNFPERGVFNLTIRGGR